MRLEPTMSRGEVTFWDSERAYGFATNSDPFAPKVFLHISKFVERIDCDAIAPGTKLSFEVTKSRDDESRTRHAANKIRILID
jgi:cold shock CspA family protein